MAQLRGAAKEDMRWRGMIAEVIADYADVPMEAAMLALENRQCLQNFLRQNGDRRDADQRQASLEREVALAFT